MPQNGSWSDQPDDVELPAWLQADDRWEDPEEDRERHLGRGRRLALLAAVPWVVALVVLLRSGDAVPSEPDEPMATGSTAAADTAGVSERASPAPAEADDEAAAGDPPAGATGPPARSDALPQPAPGPRTAVTGADAVAMATAVARAWLTGVGPTLAVPGLDPAGAHYAEHLVAEAIDHPAPGFAVVTLLGVVLDVEDGAYRSAAVHRVAVPVALDAEGARPAGSPWWLPTPDLSPAVVATTSVDDPEVALDAATALTDAGYADVALLQLERTDAWPLIATLRAIAPGREEPEEHRVWLRPHLGGLVLAGWLPQRPSTPAEDRP